MGDAAVGVHDDGAGHAHHRELAIFLKKSIFVIKKMRYNRKMTTEKDILKALRSGKIQLPPLTLSLLEEEPKPSADAKFTRPDAQIEILWDRRRWKFVVEVKATSSPKAFEEAFNAAQSAAANAKRKPMIILPYLSSDAIGRLEETGVSGLDLCGNGIVIVKGELLVVRSGQPNRFPRSEPIRNVYRGDSSYVGRAFLAKPIYQTVGEIVSTIQDKGGSVSFATVSKVLKTLEADLIVERLEDQIKLIQPEKLLEQLAENYRPPKVIERFVGKTDAQEREIPRILTDAAKRIGAELLITGSASADRYSVLAREPVVAAYCDAPPKEVLTASRIRFEETDRFPNIELIYTNDKLPFFEPAPQDGVKYASALQVYLELMSGDKRQRESAEQVREYLKRTIGKLLMDWAKEPQTT
ncbi:MAG: type IV toxin-antitoxin system AbiEi family antitoxin [Planctomycetota bacterium]|nr:type IV toxin-antitoxin system AbiEi family antitoxin [Planctomycetota bacterium]